MIEEEATGSDSNYSSSSRRRRSFASSSSSNISDADGSYSRSSSSRNSVSSSKEGHSNKGSDNSSQNQSCSSSGLLDKFIEENGLSITLDVENLLAGLLESGRDGLRSSVNVQHAKRSLRERDQAILFNSYF